ncbi:MAG: hypothetical protein AAGA68_17360 [Pseudomonadota bacterium]
MLRILKRLLGGAPTAKPAPRAKQRVGARDAPAPAALSDEHRALVEAAVLPRAATRSPPHGGPFPVKTVDSLYLWDAARARLIEVRIAFPVGGRDPQPLIVFSHGARGSKDDYQLLTQCWASWGYVCIQPSHSDARLAVEAEIADSPPASAFGDWPNRPRDVTFILDSLIDIEHRTAGLKGLIDRDRIGVGGHSFGASTAQLLGGALVIRDGRRSRPYRDPRVKALVMISPQGRGQLHADGSWDELDLPAITVTGTRDRGRDGQPWEWRLEPFHAAPAGRQYAVVLEEGAHDMGGLDRASVHLPNLSDEAIAQLVLESTLQFWNAWLKERAGDQASLRQSRTLFQGGAEARLMVR